MADRSSVSAGVALLVLALGCSATRFDRSPCQDHAECRDAFGFGAVCNPQGLCEQTQQFARCDAAYPADLLARPERYHDAVVFGSLMDRSSAPHLVRERAARLAIKQAGDLAGPAVGLVMCDIAPDLTGRLDGRSRTAAAVASAHYLVDTLGVPALIGPSASTDVEQVWQVVRGAGAAMISPAATSPTLTALEPTSSEERPGLLWRLAPPDSLQGRVIADDMLARNVRRVAVVRENGAYGEGLAAVFSDRFAAAGGSFELLPVSDDGQIAGAAGAVGGAEEVLFISSQQDWVTRFLTATAALPSSDGRHLFLTDAAASVSVFKGAAAAAALFPRIRGTRPAPRNPDDYVMATFVANYRAEYADEDPTTAAFSAHAYDAAWVALYGAAWSQFRGGTVTGIGISRGLRHLSAGPPLAIIPSSWAAVMAAFRAGRGVNVSGASGELDFDPVTREAAAPIEVWKVSGAGGQLEITRADPVRPQPESAAARGAGGARP